ncbi:hypothetical protein QZH41_019216 [Actinostola sp. cb2023]|nr:hypothetical protein QZH41_019216 [Actinostola sp. cb2023]
MISLMTSTIILLVLTSHVVHVIQGTCFTSDSNIILQNHVISSFSPSHLNECWQKCQQEARCQSLNFFVRKHLCEINNRTIELAPDDVVQNVPYTAYFQNPYRVAVGTTKDMSAVSCAEILKSVGRISGRYWLIDHARSSGPFMAYCNMTTLAIEDCAAGQCKNGGKCTYCGMGSYQCACPNRTSGRDCEISKSHPL